MMGLVSTLAALAQCCVTPPSGFVGWYAAEGEASDQLATNPGILMNGVNFMNGEAGQVFSFDGVSSYVYVPASPSIDLGSDSGLTVECWLKPGDVSTKHCVIEWNNGVDHSGMQLWTSIGSSYGDVGSLFVNFIDTSGGSHILISGANVLNFRRPSSVSHKA
jgi:hypothetical protein